MREGTVSNRYQHEVPTDISELTKTGKQRFQKIECERAEERNGDVGAGLEGG
jgi:hypothetical protein